jgi:type IX secretion system PorP/SprF family membrane protein
LGLAAGGNNFSVDLNNLDNLETTGDRAFSSYSHFNPNIGVGIYLQSEKYFLSISLPEMLSTKRYKEQNGFSTTPEDLPHFYAIAVAKLPLSSDWSWVGSTLVRYVAAVPWSVVANTGLGYKMLEVTVGYQFDAGITGTLLLKTDGVFTLGYSYQAPTAGQLASITGGSHELLLKIRLGSPTPKEETIEEERIGTHNKEIVLGSITNSLFKI